MMKNRYIIISSLLIFPFITLQAQTWEAETNFIGTLAPGGFAYQWKHYSSEHLGNRTFVMNYSGARELRHAPEAGVHPRIYFNPEDTTEIRNRLYNTRNGIEVRRKRHAFTTLLHLGYVPGTPGGTFNRNASYARSTLSGKEYINNTGYWDFKTIYYRFIAGDTTGYAAVRSKLPAYASVLSMEAFECLLNKNNTDPDTKLSYSTRAQMLSKALVTLARAAQLNGLNASTYDRTGGMPFAIAYDLNHWAMTAGQRDTVRSAIALMIPDKPRYGSDTEPYATTSNWAGLNSFEIICNLAIEGEPGYKASFTREWMKAFYKFISYGFYPSGCGWEGMGKNYMMTAQMIAFARRGYSLLGHPHVRAFGNNYLPALTQPFGFAFTGEDTWGGSGSDARLGKYKFSVFDAIGQKYAYPNDVAVDFMWRNFAGNIVNNQEIPDYCGAMEPSTQAYHDQFAVLGSYVSDWAETDYATHTQTALQKLDFMEPDRGQVIMRSGWNSSALQTIFFVRQNLGGHTYADRNDFTLSSHGRIWALKRYSGNGVDVTDAQSCILVNNLGIKITNQEGNKARQPARLHDFQSGSAFSSAIGDATYAYSWEWKWNAQPAGKDHPDLGKKDPGKEAWTKVTETLNSFRAVPQPESFYNTPFYEFAAWNSPAGYREVMIKRPFNPMEKVYRTIAMFREKKPFVIIADDVKKNASVNNFKWVMQLPADVTAELIADRGQGMYDMVLKENPGERRLLVRVLSQQDFTGGIPPARIENHSYTAGDGKNYTVYRLVCESNSVEPGFKIMLYPHIHGEQLPETTWDTTGKQLVVRWPDQTNHIGFSEVDGMTRMATLSTSTNSIATPDDGIRLFPNPASGVVHFKNAANAEIAVYDLPGRLLLKQKPVEYNNALDVSGLPTGKYIVSISGDNRTDKTILIINK
jgi:hypothetical protein